MEDKTVLKIIVQGIEYDDPDTVVLIIVDRKLTPNEVSEIERKTINFFEGIDLETALFSALESLGCTYDVVSEDYTIVF